MKLSIFLLSSIFTFGKGREWSNYSFSFSLCYPVIFPKVKGIWEFLSRKKIRKVKENEKVCAQDEGKTPKFQSSLILLHLVWESCTNKKRMKDRRIKAQFCLSEYFQYVFDEKPPVFRDGSLKGKGNRSSCHLLGRYSPISLRIFKTLGQASVWGNPTATMYKVVKNIILRNFWELKKYKLFFTAVVEEKFANRLLGVTPLHRAEEKC